MKKLMVIGMALCCVAAGTLMTGCSKANNRERFETAAKLLEPADPDNVKKNLEFFDKQNSEKQLELADRFECMVLLKKQSQGKLKGRELNMAAQERFDGLSAKQRKMSLENLRKVVEK